MNKKTFAQICGAVGVSLLISSPVLLLFGAAGSTFVLAQAAAGIVAIGAWVALDSAQLTRMFAGRGSFFLASTTGLGLVLAAGLAVLNYAVAEKFPTTWDVSKNKVHTLNDDTQKTLKSLTTTIHAYAFLAAADRQYEIAKDLLERYHQLDQARFEYEFVDPDQSPLLVEKFGIKKDNGPQVVLESDTKQQEKVAALNEEGLTNAVVKLTHQATKKIYFTSGHGEGEIKDKDSEIGFAKVVEHLANEGIVGENLSLIDNQNVPADAAAVLIVGPKKKFLDQEVATLKSYLAKGGRLVVMIDPLTQPGLDGLLKDYGVEVDNDEVIDPLSRLQGTAPDVPVIQSYGQSDITKGFTEYTVFPSTRSLVALNETGTDRPLALATTNPTAFAETDFAMLQQGKANPEGKKRGSLAVAIVAKKDVKAPDKRSDQARLVVFGSSAWADNRWSQVGGNEDLFLNTVSYLAESTDRITIRPRQRDASHVAMSPQDTTAVQFFSVDVLPVSLIAFGIAIWRVRRSK